MRWIQWKSAPERPMTHSGRARMQPRDEHGRFYKSANQRPGGVLLYRGRIPTQQELTGRAYSAEERDLIVVDESNSFSSKGVDGRENLTIVCTRIRDRDRYGDIIALIPVRKGKRTKYYNTEEPALTRIAKAISEQDIHIVERHRRLDYNALGDPDSKRRLYLNVLKSAVSDAIEIDLERETDIILDTPPVNIESELMAFGHDLSASGKPVVWFEVRRSAGDRYLSVHDYETGIVSDHVEGVQEKAYLYDNYIARRVVDGRR